VANAIFFHTINWGDYVYKVYQIQSDDTIESISLKTGVPISEIRRINSLSNEELFPGEYLVIPNQMDANFSKYIVKKGDNIYSIAEENNIDYLQLLKLNGLDENDYIYPNEEIIIPNGNFKFYITGDNDTLSSISNNLNIPVNELLKSNPKIKLQEDQMIYYRDF